MKKYLTIGMLILGSSLASAVCLTEQQIPASTPDSRFVVNNNGTVLDKDTNLMWTRCSLGRIPPDCAQGNSEYFTWDEALVAASNDTSAGFNDWRLPNLKELQSIIERQCKFLAINQNIFPYSGAYGSSYWTSTPDTNTPGTAWVMKFSYGDSYLKNHDEGFIKVLLVRDAN